MALDKPSLGLGFPICKRCLGMGPAIWGCFEGWMLPFIYKGKNPNPFSLIHQLDKSSLFVPNLLMCLCIVLWSLPSGKKVFQIYKIAFVFLKNLIILQKGLLCLLGAVRVGLSLANLKFTQETREPCRLRTHSLDWDTDYRRGNQNVKPTAPA